MKSRGYLEAMAELPSSSLDVSLHKTPSLTKLECHSALTGFQRTCSKVAPLQPHNSSSMKRRSFKFHIGHFVFSKQIEKITTLATYCYATSIAVEFALRDVPSSFLEALDILNISILSLFLVRVGFIAVATRLKHRTFALVFEAFTACCAIFATLLMLEAKNCDWDSDYFPIFSRFSKIVFAFSRTASVVTHKIEAVKRHAGRSLSIELGSDKAQAILKKVLSEPWLRCNSELYSEVLWCLDAMASDKLNQTIVVSSGEAEAGVAEKEFIDIVNRFSQVENSQPPQIQRKSSECENSGLSDCELPMRDLTEEVEQCLADVNSSNFDVFRLKKATFGNELYTLAVFFCIKSTLFSTLGINQAHFSRYGKVIQEGYDRNVIYHNATHAADTIQTLHYFLFTCDAVEIGSLTPIELLAAYVAAMAHDFEHPGMTNSFLISTQTELAIRYNDKSVLENHHVSAAFAAAINHDCDFFSDLSQENYSRLRAIIIEMVLSTDSVNHFSLLSRFKTKFTAFGISQDKDDHQLCLEVLLHSADISNPTKPWELCQKWTQLILNEFWLQGDKERRLGMPLSYLTDRKTVNVPKSQIGFIDVIVEPLFVALRDVFPAVENSCENLSANRERWRGIATTTSDPSLACEVQFQDSP